ncbi:MAG TPA: histidine kinase [Anaerolineales bacterium]|nr:histidine kinase [Anaerolineales bacterium]
MTTQTESHTRLHGRWLLITRLAWGIMFAILTVMYALGFLEVREALSTVCEEELCTLREQIRHTDAGEQVVRSPGPPIGYADRLRPDQVEALERLGLTLDQYSWLGALQIGLPVLVYLLIAAGLFWRRSDDLMVLFASVMVATIPDANGPLPFTLVVHRPAWEGVSDLAGVIALSCFLIFPLIFPNGRFVPRWTRWIMLYEVAGAVIIALFQNSILERPGAEKFILVYLLIAFGTGIYAQLYRYFRVASPVERQQLKWVIVGLAGFVSIALVVLLPLDALLTSRAAAMDPARALLLSVIPDTIFQVILLFIPVSIAISVLRYRLWDIDFIISRTLVYGALTATVVGFYVLVVGGFGMLFQMQNNLPAIIIAILFIAFLLQPLRRRLQDVVNRFVPAPKVIMRESIPPLVAQTGQEQKAAITDSVPNTALHGWWLTIARLAWAAGFIGLTVVYIFGFLAVRDALSTVCEDRQCTLTRQIRHTNVGDQVVTSAGPSIGSAERLRPEQVQALEKFGLTLDQYGWVGALQLGIPALLLLLIAAGLFWRKSNDWMVLFASAMVATFSIHNTPLLFTLTLHQPTWGWASHLASIVALSCLLIFPLIFPNGAFVPHWTRWMAIYDVAGAVMASFLGSAMLEVLGGVLGRVFIGLCVLLPFGIGVYAQLYRYFRVARPAERQQFKWVVVGFVGALVAQFAVLIPLNALLTSRAINADPAQALVLSTIPDTLWQVSILLIPVCITISVLRYRLWDIDVFINRSLVYGALIVSVIGLYMVVVGVAGALFQFIGNTLLAILATGLIAVLFHPLRQRLQRGINRLMYGERDDPYSALSRLGRRLESSLAPESVLPTVVTTVRDVLKLPYVAIYLQQNSEGYKIVAESASPSLRLENGRIVVPGMGQVGLCFPLIHQGETLGYIVLGPRAPNEAFGSTDLHLLEDLAPQVGVAVHAVRLTADLQRSRERLVLAREEERRRLRRDLHDDLGPTLASLGLAASTVADLIPTNPAAATKLVKELESQMRATVGNVRRLVYDLRPPALDELGLLAAVRERATRYSNAPDGFQVTVDAPAQLPALPAAVEVAAYRIVQEALENVSKHAQARQCTIRFANHAGLEIEITDDGIGLPSNLTPGIGLRSMRERAEELGGHCVIERGANGGTRLLACLPIGESNGSVTHPDRG